MPFLRLAQDGTNRSCSTALFSMASMGREFWVTHGFGTKTWCEGGALNASRHLRPKRVQNGCRPSFRFIHLYGRFCGLIPRETSKLRWPLPRLGGDRTAAARLPKRPLQKAIRHQKTAIRVASVSVFNYIYAPGTARYSCPWRKAGAQRGPST